MKHIFKLLLVGIIILIACGTGIITREQYDNYKINAIIKEYSKIDKNDTEKLCEISKYPETMTDVGTYTQYERECLGNSNCNLLSGGIACEVDGGICSSENGETLYNNSGKRIVVNKGTSSYINYMNKIIYYRDDSSRAICSYNIETDKIKEIYNGNVGEMIVDRHGISYIDFDDYTLKHMSLDGNNVSQIYKGKTISFAIVGTAYICLRRDGTILAINPGGLENVIDTNVDRFYFNGTLAYQKGTNIYVSYDLKNIDNTINDSRILAGINDDLLLLYDNNSLIEQKLDNTKNNKSRTIGTWKTDDIFKSVNVVYGSYYIVTMEC